MSIATTSKTTDLFAIATAYLNQVYANLKHNNVNLPLLIWLNAQTRLLEYHKGKQEVLPHVWLQGRAEIGSYAMNRALELLPEGTVETYQGASPKRFPRDTADLRHHVVFLKKRTRWHSAKRMPWLNHFDSQWIPVILFTRPRTGAVADGSHETSDAKDRSSFGARHFNHQGRNWHHAWRLRTPHHSPLL